jgi:hypothetical protein
MNNSEIIILTKNLTLNSYSFHYYINTTKVITINLNMSVSAPFVEAKVISKKLLFLF